MTVMIPGLILTGCFEDILNELTGKEEVDNSGLIVAAAAAAVVSMPSSSTNSLVGSCDTRTIAGICTEYSGWGWAGTDIQSLCPTEGVASTGPCPTVERYGICIYAPESGLEYSRVYYNDFNTYVKNTDLATEMTICQSGEASNITKWIQL